MYNLKLSKLFLKLVWVDVALLIVFHGAMPFIVALPILFLVGLMFA